MKAFQVDSLLAAQAGSKDRYLEFLRDGFFSAGLYVLKAGSEDPQTPHAEDEVYVVVRGRARFESEGRSEAVSPGSILYVPARAVHRFQGIEDDLAVLVFFAPPETAV
jgi:mannose-6-phosphate isomerase-like protein (cupin superfamily)